MQCKQGIQCLNVSLVSGLWSVTYQIRSLSLAGLRGWKTLSLNLCTSLIYVLFLFFLAKLKLLKVQSLQVFTSEMWHHLLRMSSWRCNTLKQVSRIGPQYVFEIYRFLYYIIFSLASCSHASCIREPSCPTKNESDGTFISAISHCWSLGGRVKA